MLLLPRVREAGARVAGHDDAYADAVLAHLVSQGEGDGVDGGFAGGVEGLVGDGDGCGNGAREDDGSAALRAHVREDRLGGVDLPEEVDVHDLVGCLGARELNRAGDAHAGVCAEQVDPALAEGNLRNGGADRCLVGDVRAQGGHALRSNSSSADAVDRVSRVAQLRAYFIANARASAGNDCDHCKPSRTIVLNDCRSLRNRR